MTEQERQEALADEFFAKAMSATNRHLTLQKLEAEVVTTQALVCLTDVPDLVLDNRSGFKTVMYVTASLLSSQTESVRAPEKDNPSLQKQLRTDRAPEALQSSFRKVTEDIFKAVLDLYPGYTPGFYFAFTKHLMELCSKHSLFVSVIAKEPNAVLWLSELIDEALAIRNKLANGKKPETSTTHH